MAPWTRSHLAVVEAVVEEHLDVPVVVAIGRAASGAPEWGVLLIESEQGPSVAVLYRLCDLGRTLERMDLHVTGPPWMASRGWSAPISMTPWGVPGRAARSWSMTVGGRNLTSDARAPHSPQ